MALTDDGRIFTWGGTLHGKSGLGHEHKKKAVKYMPQELAYFRENQLVVSHIACGQNHSLAIARKISQQGNKRRQLYSWGDQQWY